MKKTQLPLAIVAALLGVFALLQMQRERGSASQPAVSVPNGAAALLCRTGEECAGGARTSAVPAIGAAELAAMLEKKDFFFVNVHVPYEGEIAGTDAFVPYDKIADNLGKLPQDKNARVVLYCRSGRMSEIAGKTLAGLGYTNVSHLFGGMIDWERSGYSASVD